MDDAKKKILARRAKFVAAAIAGLAASCGKEDAPRPCLSPPPIPADASVGPPPPPQPCLSVAVPQEPPPQPCLGPPANADCVTPYFYDAQGVKHYKPQCLK